MPGGKIGTIVPGTGGGEVGGNLVGVGMVTMLLQEKQANGAQYPII